MSATKVKEFIKSFEELSSDEKRVFLSRVLAVHARTITRLKKGKTLFYYAAERSSRGDKASVSPSSQTGQGHWGSDLIGLRNTLNMGTWTDIGDSVDYVQKLREDELKSRLGDWGADE